MTTQAGMYPILQEPTTYAQGYNNPPTYYNTNAQQSQITPSGTTQTKLVTQKERRNRIAIIDPTTGQDVAVENAVQNVSDSGSRSTPVGSSTEPTPSKSPNNEIAAQFAAEVAKRLNHPSMQQKMNSPITSPPQQTQPPAQHSQQQQCLTQPPQKQQPLTQPQHQSQPLTQTQHIMKQPPPLTHPNLCKLHITQAPPHPVRGNVPLQMPTQSPVNMQSVPLPSNGIIPVSVQGMPLGVTRPMPGIPDGTQGIEKDLQSQNGDYKGPTLAIQMDKSDIKPNSATTVLVNSNSPSLSNKPDIPVPQMPPSQMVGTCPVQELVKSNEVLKVHPVQEKQIDLSQSNTVSVDSVPGKQIESLHASEAVNVVTTESTIVPVLFEKFSVSVDKNEVVRQVTSEVVVRAAPSVEKDFKMDLDNKPEVITTESSSVAKKAKAKRKAWDREINKKCENISSSVFDAYTDDSAVQRITTQAGMYPQPKQPTTYAQQYKNPPTYYNTNAQQSQRTPSCATQTSLVSKKERRNRIPIIDPTTGQDMAVKNAVQNASDSGSRSTTVGSNTEPTPSQTPNNEIAAQFAAQVAKKLNHPSVQQQMTSPITSPPQQKQPLAQPPQQQQPLAQPPQQPHPLTKPPQMIQQPPPATDPNLGKPHITQAPPHPVQGNVPLQMPTQPPMNMQSVPPPSHGMIPVPVSGITPGVTRPMPGIPDGAQGIEKDLQSQNGNYKSQPPSIHMDKSDMKHYSATTVLVNSNSPSLSNKPDKPVPQMPPPQMVGTSPVQVPVKSNDVLKEDTVQDKQIDLSHLNTVSVDYVPGKQIELHAIERVNVVTTDSTSVPVLSEKSSDSVNKNKVVRQVSPEVVVSPATPVEKDIKMDLDKKPEEITTESSSDKAKKKPRDREINKEGENISSSVFDGYTDESAVFPQQRLTTQAGMYQMPYQPTTYAQGYNNPPSYHYTNAQQSQRAPSSTTQTSLVSKKERRNRIPIIDPTTGQDVTVENAVQNASDSGSRSTPVRSSTEPTPSQSPNNEIAAQFAVEVAKRLKHPSVQQHMTSPITSPPQQQQPLTQSPQQQQPLTQPPQMKQQPPPHIHHSLGKPHITQAPSHPVQGNVPLQMPTQPPVNMNNLPPPSHGMIPVPVPGMPLGVTRPMPGIPYGSQRIEKDLQSQNGEYRGQPPSIHMDKSGMRPNSATTVLANSNSLSLSQKPDISVPQMPPPQMVGTSPVQEPVKLNDVLKKDPVQDKQINLSQSNTVSVGYVPDKQIKSLHASEPVNVVTTKSTSVPVLSENSSDSLDKNEVVRQVTPEVVVSPATPVEKDIKMDLDKKPEEITTESSSVAKKAKAKKKAWDREINKKCENISSSVFDAYTDESAVQRMTTQAGMYPQPKQPTTYAQRYQNPPTYYSTNAQQSQRTPSCATQTSLDSKKERRNRIPIIDPTTGQDMAVKNAVQNASDSGSRSTSVGSSTEPTSSQTPNNEIAAQFAAEVAKKLNHPSVQQQITSPITSPPQQKQPLAQPPQQQQPLTQPLQQPQPLTKTPQIMQQPPPATDPNLGKPHITQAPPHPVQGNVPLQMPTQPPMNMQSVSPPSHGMIPVPVLGMPPGVTRPMPGIPDGAQGIEKDLQSQNGNNKGQPPSIHMDKSDMKHYSATTVLVNSNSPSLSNKPDKPVPEMPPPQMVGTSPVQEPVKSNDVLKEDTVQDKQIDLSQLNTVSVDYVPGKQIELHAIEPSNVVTTESTSVPVLSEKSSDSVNNNKVVRQVSPEVVVSPATPVEKDIKMDLDKKPEEITTDSSSDKAKKKARDRDINKKGEQISSSVFAYTDESAVLLQQRMTTQAGMYPMPQQPTTYAQGYNNPPTYYNTNAQQSQRTPSGTTQTSLVSKKERRNRIPIIDPTTGQDVAFENAVQNASDSGSRSTPVGSSTEPTPCQCPNNEIAAQFAADVAKRLNYPSMQQQMTSPITCPPQQTQSLTQPPQQQQPPWQHQPLTQAPQQQQALTQPPLTMQRQPPTIHHNLSKPHITQAPPLPVQGNVSIQILTKLPVNMQSATHGMIPIPVPGMPLRLTRPMPGIPDSAHGIEKDLQSQNGEYRGQPPSIQMDKSDMKTNSETTLLVNSNSPSMSNKPDIPVPQMPQTQGTSPVQEPVKSNDVSKKDPVQDKQIDLSQLNTVSVDSVPGKQIESLHASEPVNGVTTESTSVPVLSEKSSASVDKNEEVRQVTPVTPEVVVRPATPVEKDFKINLEKKPEEITTEFVSVSKKDKSKKKARDREINIKGEIISSSVFDAYTDESAVPTPSQSHNYEIAAQFAAEVNKRLNHPSMQKQMTSPITSPSQQKQPLARPPQQQQLLTQPPHQQQPPTQPTQQQQSLTPPPQQQQLLTQPPQQQQPLTQPPQQQQPLTQLLEQPQPLTQPPQTMQHPPSPIHPNLGKPDITQAPPHPVQGNVPLQMPNQPPVNVQSVTPPSHGMIPVPLSGIPLVVTRPMPGIPDGAQGTEKDLQSQYGDYRGQPYSIQMDKSDMKPNSATTVLVNSISPSLSIKPDIPVPQMPPPQIVGTSPVQEPVKSNDVFKENPVQDKQIDLSQSNTVSVDSVPGKQIKSLHASEPVNVVTTESTSVPVLSEKSSDSVDKNEVVRQVSPEVVVRHATPFEKDFKMDLDKKPDEITTASSSVYKKDKPKKKAKDRKIKKKGETISSSVFDAYTDESAVLPQQRMTTQAGMYPMSQQPTTYAQGYNNLPTYYNTNAQQSQKSPSGTTQTSLVSKKERRNRISIIDPTTGEDVVVENTEQNVSDLGSRSAPVGSSTEPTPSQSPNNEIAAQFAAEVAKRLNQPSMQQQMTSPITSLPQQQQPLTQPPQQQQPITQPPQQQQPPWQHQPLIQPQQQPQTLTQPPQMMQQPSAPSHPDLVSKKDKVKKKARDREINKRGEKTTSSVIDAYTDESAMARQTVTDGVRPANSAEINPMGQQVTILTNILQQFMQQYSFVPFGQIPHYPSYYPQPLPPGGAPFGQFPQHPSYYFQPLHLGGEGVRFQGEGPIPTNHTSQFKKARDETLTQNVVDILNNCMKSVGCLNTPFQKGTAFLVGDRFVITAFHVIREVSDDMYTMDRRTVDPGNPIPFVYVNFNECLDHPSQVLYRLNKPCFTDPALDVAILEIVYPNSFLPPRLPLSKTGGPKSKVSIIGYGHPGTNSKHLDPNCPVLAANSGRVIGAINQVWSEIGTIRHNLVDPDIVNTSFEGYDDPSRFLLDCFFEHGGSGGPAIDHEVPSSTEVVGIYVRGFPTFFFDLPKHMQDSYRDMFRFEMCTRTSSLYSVLSASDEAFANNIFG